MTMGLLLLALAGVSAAADGKEKIVGQKKSPGAEVSGSPVQSFHLPPVAEFLPPEKAGEIFDVPYIGALCRLPMLIELLPPNMLGPVFTGIVTDPPVAVTPLGCRDGVFKADSPPNFFGYRYVITLAIKDDKILSANYDEVNRSGKGKKGDKEYYTEMEKSGTTPAIAYPSYERQLLITQDLTRVDAVSGATYSLYRFKTVAALALSEARKIK